MNAEAARVVTKLGLLPLPYEGGFFTQTWRSSVLLPGGRSTGSAIYFLVTPSDFSALHRLRTEELWCFHAGDPVEHCQLGSAASKAHCTLLGADVAGDQTAQLLVRSDVWQGARLAPGGTRGWALMSCFMAPAWDEREFELGARPDLLRDFPAAAEQIHGLTRVEST